MTAPAQDVEPGGMRALVLAAKDRITAYIPPGIPFDMVVHQCFVETKKNPAILKCSAESIVQAVCTILQWGLVIGQTGYLIPYKDKHNSQGLKVCTPVADYKGLARLMVISGAVRHVFAKAVYAGDFFDYEFGLDGYLKHKPCPKSKRGDIRASYVILDLPGGTRVFDVMEIEDIEEIRKTSAKWGPDKVRECPGWYAKKTVIRQSAKLVPLTPKFQQALSVIEAEREMEDDVADATPPMTSEVKSLNAGTPTHVEPAKREQTAEEIRLEDQRLVEREQQGNR